MPAGRYKRLNGLKLCSPERVQKGAFETREGYPNGAFQQPFTILNTLRNEIHGQLCVMVSRGAIDAIGAVGGVILAICQGPQLYKIWRTKSAADLSYIFIALYSLGLFFICVYVSATLPTDMSCNLQHEAPFRQSCSCS